MHNLGGILKRLLIDKIENLPKLPDSIIELNKFRESNSAEPEELIKIIKSDPLIVSSILRIANSSIFGFRSHIDTLSRAINLLGINFTISIAIGMIILNNIKGSLKAYNIDNEYFIENSALATKITNTWISSIDFDLKEELLLPAFLQEIGKFVISEIIQEKDKIQEFQEKLNTLENISKIESQIVGFSCSRITANIFRYWGFNYKIIFSVGFIDNLKECPKDFLRHCQILEIVKILSDFRDPLGDQQIQLALEKASEFGFSQEHLLNTIDVVNEEISSHS